MTKAVPRKSPTRRPRLAKAVVTIEPAYSKARPMTGFLATLSAEQRAKALAHEGDDTVGDPRSYKK